MEKEFMTAIEAAAERLKLRLISEAAADFRQHHKKDTSLTPTGAQKLAEKYILMFLGQEISFRTTNNLHQKP